MGAGGELSLKRGGLVGYALTLVVSVLFFISSKDRLPVSVKFDDVDYITVAASALKSSHEGAVPVTLFDFDQASVQSLGDEARVSRGNLIELLEIADRSNPTAIVLDFDIANTRKDEQEVVRRYFFERAIDAPPLLLVRALSRLPVGRDVPGAVIDTPNSLDPTARSRSNIAWVSAYLDTEADGSARRWRAYHPVCADGPARGYPAVALITTAISRDPQSGRAAAQDWLSQASLQSCGRSGQMSDQETKPASRAWLRNAAEVMTIPYVVGHTTELARFGSTMIDGKQVPVFSRITARQLLDKSPELRGTGVADQAGRVVIIGASYNNSGDWQKTPLGRMPGMYVLANLVAFGPSALEDKKWWGLKGLLLGYLIFVFHEICKYVMRQGLANVAFLFITGSILTLLVAAGLSVATAYEGAIVGIALTILHSIVTSMLTLFSTPERPPHVGRFASLVLSERMQERLSARRTRGG